MGLNDILAAIDNAKRVAARNTRDAYNDPIGTLSMIANRVKDSLSTPEGAKEFMYNSMAPGVGGIIKSKGGNWLTGSVESALSGLKSAEYMVPAREVVNPWGERTVLPAIEDEVSRRGTALNRWIEGPLTKYVKRDMATEGDPVRKLAEQGILHFEVPSGRTIFENANYNRNSADRFVRTPTLNSPGQQLGISPLAKDWENVSDVAVRPMDPSFVREVRNISPVDEAWISKLDQTTPIHEIAGGGRGIDDLGFSHLTDELANALNPESGLPRHLQLTPEQMQQLGMEKAVRHVADINAWRAAQQAEANLAKSQSPAVHLVREYAENNPKGLRWVELRKPEAKLEDGWKVVPQGDTGLFEVVDDMGRQRSVGASEKEAIGLLNRKERQQLLADQLKYEGDTMGHCVGGYCDAVASGKSRIFSLRDAKGEPHVTIETRNGKPELKATIEDLFDLSKTTEKVPDTIIQIKGKQNRKPNDEYLPFVQDFVRNHPEGGKWGDIGDLHNTGLRQSRNVWNDMEQAKIREAGHEIPDYVLPADIETINKAVWPNDSAYQISIPKTQDYAEGGVVRAEQQWQPFAGGYILR